MKAIVLTCDKYRPMAVNMMQSYQTLWPENPLVFHVPYQAYPSDLKKKYGDKIELIQTEKDITSTLKTLLQDVDDDEWVYWCIDDRYPIYIDTKKLSSIHNWLSNNSNIDIAGIGFAYNQRDWNAENIMPKRFSIKDQNGCMYYRVTNYKIIWFHQFMKAKVLKNLISNFPAVIDGAKEMDRIKDNTELPLDYGRYIYPQRLVEFGESTNRGKITLNCVQSMECFGIQIPDNFEILNKTIFKGSSKYEKPKLYYLLRRVLIWLKKYSRI